VVQAQTKKKIYNIIKIIGRVRHILINTLKIP